MQRHSLENLPIRWWIQLFQTNVKSHIFTKKSIWRWTTNGEYTAKSAYNAQFFGSYTTSRGDYIWRAEVEGKHKFFTWLLVQSKILTADKLLARQWPCNPICPLCSQEQETASHLILHCTFAQKFGVKWKAGHFTWTVNQALVSWSRIGGRRNWRNFSRKQGELRQLSWSTRPGKFGRKGIRESWITRLPHQQRCCKRSRMKSLKGRWLAVDQSYPLCLICSCSLLEYECFSFYVTRWYTMRCCGIS